MKGRCTACIILPMSPQTRTPIRKPAAPSASSIRWAGAASAALAALALVACAPLGRSNDGAQGAATGTSAGATSVALPSPVAARSWAQFKLQAAQRIMAASPGQTYTGTPPEVLLAVPVLEVELHADGSIKRIDVLRQPRQATETVPMAMAAVRRAAPYGDVSRLPRPWRFTETFLFDDQRRFLVRTLAP